MNFFVFIILALPLLVCSDSASYWEERQQVLDEEAELIIGSQITLSEDEERVNEILMQMKADEFEISFENDTINAWAVNFFKRRAYIEQSEVFKFIQKFPKGANLHTHDSALVSQEFLFNLTYMDNLYICFNGSNLRFIFLASVEDGQDCEWQLLSDVRASDSTIDELINEKITLFTDHPEKYLSEDQVWVAFEEILSTVIPIFNYRPAFEAFFYQALVEMYEDNVIYMEVRAFPGGVYDLNGTTYDPVEIIGIYQNVLDQFLIDYPDFIGAKIIYSVLRRIDNATMWERIETFTEMVDNYPGFVIGFDLVNQEKKGYALKDFYDQLISIQNLSPSVSCPVPQLTVNGSNKGNIRLNADYRRIREVKFSGAIGPLGEKRLCKIKCIGGQWVGPLCLSEDQKDSGRFHPLFRNCKLEYINPHLVVTFRNIPIQAVGWIFPHGAKLQTRCRELGLYKLLGSASPQCQNGAWTHKLPSCVPTTLLTNFTEDSPPTILIKIPSGSASVEPGGELAVYPGSTIHLECLFSRRLGSPDWTWTSPLGQYLTGWAISSEERDWKYRLSIYYIKSQDSGTFTCATPRGITNSITLHVAAIHCDAISISSMHMSVRVEGTRLGHRAIFQCPVGYRINGDGNLTCQASGKWSSPMPSCEPVKCPSLNAPGGLTEPHLQLEEHNSSYGGRAVFSCSWGYTLIGPPGIECEISGNWSGPLPKCVPIQCPPPVIPVNGHLIQSESAGMDGERFAVGSLVQFACEGSFLLEGEASIICTESGVWSHPAPFCKPRCPYLGEPQNGHLVPSKFTYEPGDELQVVCDPGYEIPIEPRPKCMENGNWSMPLPHCTNYSQI